jgi:hypothetical protein
MRLFAGGFRKKEGALNDEVAPEFVEIAGVGTTKSVGTTRSVNAPAISRAGTYNAPQSLHAPAMSRAGTYNAPRPAVSGFQNESYDDSV